jgi:preprotein translocase subunit SecD
MINFPKWKIITVLTICVLGILFALPNVLTRDQLASVPGWLPSSQMNLGLDLRGGAHLLIEAKIEDALREGLESLQQGARSALRKENIGYTGLALIQNGIAVTIRKDEDVERARLALQTLGGNASPNIADGIVLERDGSRFTLKYSEQLLRDRRRAILEQAITILNVRINALGLTEPSIQRQGTDRILVQAPGGDPEKLKNIIGQTAKMTFHLLEPEVQTLDPKRRVRPGTMLLKGKTDVSATGQPIYYLVKKRVEVSGENLVDAQATVEQGQAVVSFRFDPVGARRFGNVTKRNVGKPFAIVLDKEVISAPTIREAILGGSGIISGSFSTEGARDLALLLRSGALPVPLTIIEERSVGPSLGADSIAAGKLASIGALIAVIVFMAFAYGWFGIMANVALALNLVLLAAALSILQATLTLPGIAGIILTIGMAVDANVLVFERIREEERSGRTPISAVDTGYKRAFTTIIDANLTTFIAALLLYMFGSGPVRGFAVTLAIGVMTSMFSAIMVTRLMVVIWLRKKRPKKLPL